MFRLYYNLCKPGIVYGNALTAAAGFFLASRGEIHFGVFAAMVIGISLVIASACVFNNYFDRDVDAKMDRTKDRALAAGRIPPSHALIFGLVLGALGLKLLLLYTNVLTTGIALFGFFVYVCIYTFAKRATQFATEIGALAGAVPPVIGYTAVTNTLDTGAALLFLILFVWQMPHFFAIAINREEDYRAAGTPVRPIETGIFRTKLVISLYVATFVFAVITPTLVGLTNLLYAIVLTPISLAWLALCISGFYTRDARRWARRVFLFSLLVLSAFSLMLILN